MTVRMFHQQWHEIEPMRREADNPNNIAGPFEA
jgi:hypothetical protein